MRDASQLRFGIYTLLVALCISGVLTGCPIFREISIQDAKDAALASKHVYKPVSTGYIKIPGSQYHVIKTVEKSLLGESIKVLVADEGNRRIIAFRGTISPKQLFQQFAKGVKNLKRKKYISILRKKNGRTWRENVMALEFVIEAYRKLKDDLAIYMNKATFRYIITGHSLGGAIGSLFALMQRANSPSTWTKYGSCLITFGAPRVGGAHYARIHDKMISPNRKIRFVNELDIAPHVPPMSSGFRHHSREVWLGMVKTCRKVKRWWWTRRVCDRTHTGAWKVCKEGEDYGCSNGMRYISYRPSYHGIGRYIAKLRKVPGAIYDKHNHKYSSWSSAIRHSCSSY